jgi:lipopolysaccharide transport system ATP-binding protein
MGEVVINVSNLSKQYKLGQIGTGSLTHDIRRWWSNVRGKEDPFLKIGEQNDRTRKGSSDYVWAIRDIDFDVNHGDVLGIIGRNGAGKSTLLKILSRTTAPSTGSVNIKGRVASLLEVGTGFHPELSGRENIFLNGAILGMRKKEIANKFDEIVDFSGVERYVDTPVKRYSSGMYVRLAFAVAAHLEPEILIIDEVLAVGDNEFQKKCLGKMNSVSKLEGRTVLFVSHSMGSISQLCEKTIVMDKGGIVFNGETDQGVNFYLNNVSKIAKNIRRSQVGNSNQFITVYNADDKNVEKSDFRFDEDLHLFVELNIPVYRSSLELAISLYDKYKRRVFTIHEPLQKYYLGKKVFKFQIKIPGKFITPGTYSWLMCINEPGIGLTDLQDDVCGFTIVDTGSEFARYESGYYGCVNVNYQIKEIH